MPHNADRPARTGRRHMDLEDASEFASHTHPATAAPKTALQLSTKCTCMLHSQGKAVCRECRSSTRCQYQSHDNGHVSHVRCSHLYISAVEMATRKSNSVSNAALNSQCRCAGAHDVEYWRRYSRGNLGRVECEQPNWKRIISHTQQQLLGQAV